VSTAAARSRARPRRARHAVRRRRRLLTAGAVLLSVIALAILLAFRPLQNAVREITLPLRHEDVIRQQSDQKGVDAALMAAVIYQESKFRPRTSPAGAEGLMQILPSTAKFIARRTGGTAFVPSDLGTPQVNIAYGSYYLRYLLDRYGGSRTLAVAAYNAGETNVDRWVRRAGGAARFDEGDIPFPETRSYVGSVEQHEKDYARHYGRELGLK
jgi:soluble lytic murein transglycosylase